MDLIYMNVEKEDIGVLLDSTLDMAFGEDENDFECKLAKSSHCCKKDYYLYIEGTEYGGMIDDIGIDTNNEEVTYYGRTWHGILNSKILEPDAGEDYLTISGEANDVITILIVRMGLTSLFAASNEDSGINIANYKMNRYIAGYDGIRKMLKAAGAKLHMEFLNGTVILSAKPIVDYSEDEQFDTDQISFKIKKKGNPINHVVCLGKGDLAEREVIHVYADKNGAISNQQSMKGILEVAAIYDNANTESSEKLEQGGIDIITASWNSDEIDFEFEADKESYDIGDIIGAREEVTGIEVRAEITKKIVTIDNDTTTITYKVGK